MQRITPSSARQATDQPGWDADLRVIMSRMTCTCAEAATHAEAPMARALFHRVEVMKQPPKLAALALGIEPGDAAYLLAGLRADVARDLVFLLGGRRWPQTPPAKAVSGSGAEPGNHKESSDD